MKEDIVAAEAHQAVHQVPHQVIDSDHINYI